MAITKLNPNTIHLGGPATLINEYAATETITPGMIVEYVNDGGVPGWGVHDSADDVCGRFVALDQSELNLGVDSTYADGDLMKVAHCQPGATVWAIIPSGQNLACGAKLQSNGDGKLKALATGTALCIALEAKNVTADSRIRVEMI